MKPIIIAIFLLSSLATVAQPALYDPAENASTALDSCIKKARKENKHVLIQVGGNWCKWCIEFHRFIKADKKIDSLIQSEFVYCLVNYSKENKNLEILSRLGFPQRFGFPVFVILDGEGVRLHTQNSAYLEDGKKSYDAQTVMDFLKQWTPRSIDPNSYEK